MSYIELTKGKRAIVDDEDFDYLNQWKWCYVSSGYAMRRKYLGGGRGNEKAEYILMHRLIAGTPKDMDTDHINRDRLDNRKSNLRICTTAENLRNSKGYSKKTKYKGLDLVGARWRARVTIAGKTLSLGIYDSEEEAASAYNNAITNYHGSFAKLNEIGG